MAESAGKLDDIGYAHLVNCVFQATQGGWSELDRSHARAAEIYRQLGVGVRWQSPVGLVRVDVGFPLRRQPDEKAYRLFYSLGQAF